MDGRDKPGHDALGRRSVRRRKMEPCVTPINIARKLGQFSEHWSPKIVATFNGHDVMVVKLKGEFVWHSHPDTDDFFYS